MTPRQIRVDRGTHNTVVWCTACNGREMVFSAAAEQAWIVEHLAQVHDDTRRASNLKAKRKYRAEGGTP